MIRSLIIFSCFLLSGSDVLIKPGRTTMDINSGAAEVSAQSSPAYSGLSSSSPFDPSAEINLYFDASLTTPGSGSLMDPYGRNAELAEDIRSHSDPGDIVALWVTGNGRQNEGFDQGYGRIGRLPAGRIYRIRGHGNQAVLSGAKRLHNFTYMGNNVWRTPIKAEIAALYVQGQYADLATDGRMYRFDAFSSPHMESKELYGQKPDGYFNGCKVESAYQVWNPFRASVKDFRNDTHGNALIEIDTRRLPDNIAPNPGLKISMQFFGHPDFLQPVFNPKNNDWAYDRKNGFLYIFSYFNPNNLVIEAAIADYGIEIGDRPTHNIQATVENITFEKFAKDGIKFQGIYHDCEIRNNLFNACTRNGITLLGGPDENRNTNNLIDNNRYNDFGAGAIFALRPNRSTFSNNTGHALETTRHVGFQDAPLPGNSAYGVSNLGDAIHINNYTGTENSRVTVTRNTFSRAQVNGLTVSGQHNTVSENRISNFGQLACDVGGIYMGGSWNKYNTIIGNTIFNALGAARYVTDLPSFPAYGIYIDHNASNAYLHQNNVYSCDAGVFLNIGADNSEITDNIFTANTYNIQVSHAYIDKIDQADNLKITGNTMIVLDQSQKHWFLFAPFDPAKNAYHRGTVNNNTYSSAQRGAAFVAVLNGRNADRMREGVSFEMWQALTGYDAGSSENYTGAPEYTMNGSSAIENSFRESQRIETSMAAGEFDKQVMRMSFSGENATILPGELFIAVFQAANSRTGGILEARLWDGHAFVEGCKSYFATTPATGSYTMYWENTTSFPVTLDYVMFRVKGIDGRPYTQTITSFTPRKSADFKKTRPEDLESEVGRR